MIVSHSAKIAVLAMVELASQGMVNGCRPRAWLKQSVSICPSYSTSSIGSRMLASSDPSTADKAASSWR